MLYINYYFCKSEDIWGEFNKTSAHGHSLYWCQASHITYKDRYQNNERPQALALLNSPYISQCDHITYSQPSL